MNDATKKALDQALSSPEFMSQVREAVLASPIVQAKDAEIARLRAALTEAEKERDLARELLNGDDVTALELGKGRVIDLEFECGRLEMERAAAQARAEAAEREVSRLTREMDEARRDREHYRFHAQGADEWRARAEEAESRRDFNEARAALAIKQRDAAESSLAAARDVLPPFVAALDSLVFHRAEDGTTTVTGKAVDDFDAWRGFVDALIKVRALVAALVGGSHG